MRGHLAVALQQQGLQLALRVLEEHVRGRALREEDRSRADPEGEHQVRARRIAEERGISLSNIAGSGPGGRITKKDVEEFEPNLASNPTISVSAETTANEETVSPIVEPVTTPSAPGEKQPLSRMRQQIARVTVKSKSEKPHFYVSAEINMTNAMSLRKQINDQLKDDGVRLTVNDLIVKACIQALQKYPKFNAYYENDGIQFNDCLLYTSPSPRDGLLYRMPSSA